MLLKIDLTLISLNCIKVVLFTKIYIIKISTNEGIILTDKIIKNNS